MDVNDEGATVKLGNDQYKDIGHDGSHKYYCGRRMPIPGTDGQCGPSGGPQCKSCLRFQEKKDLGDKKKQRSSSFDDGGGDGDALPADLCAAEWEKLTPEEQSNYRAVEPPTRTLAVPASGVRLTWTSPAPPATAETAAEAAKGISVLSDSAFASLPEGAKKPEGFQMGAGKGAKGKEARKGKGEAARRAEERGGLDVVVRGGGVSVAPAASADPADCAARRAGGGGAGAPARSARDAGARARVSDGARRACRRRRRQRHRRRRAARRALPRRPRAGRRDACRRRRGRRRRRAAAARSVQVGGASKRCGGSTRRRGGSREARLRCGLLRR